MARPAGSKNIMRTAAEKEKIVLEYLNGKTGYKRVAESYDLEPASLFKWIKQYQQNGIKELESQTGRKEGLNQGRPKKPTTEEERLKREIAKLEIEVARLKKGYQVKGVGDQKEFVTTFDVNTKSSNN